MKRLAFLAFAFLCATAAALAQAGLQPAALVNLIRPEPIAVGQFRAEVERFEASLGRSLSGQQRRELLDAMINERLVLQAAERDRVSVSDGELSQHINLIREQMSQMIGRPLTEAEFAGLVRNETGLEMPAFREHTRRQLVQQAYLRTRQRATLESAVPPTQAEVLSMFELNRAQFVRPETARVSMILVPFGANAATRTAARQEADRLRAEIGSSAANFNALAARAGAPGSSFMGDSGYVGRTMEFAQVYGQAFINAVFSLPVGGISAVLEGPPGSGFMIVMVTESLAMRNLELNDPIQPGEPRTVRDHIAEAIFQSRQAEAFERAVNALHEELRAGGRTFQVFEANLNW